VDLVCIPTFTDIEIDGESRTAIRLSVEDRTHKAVANNDGNAGKATATTKADADGSLEPAHATI